MLGDGLSLLRLECMGSRCLVRWEHRQASSGMHHVVDIAHLTLWSTWALGIVVVFVRLKQHNFVSLPQVTSKSLNAMGSG